MTNPIDSRLPFAGLDRLSRHLNYHTERQAVIACNVTNLDTPGYRARDVSFTETVEHVASAEGDQLTMSHATETIVADDETPDEDGNTVSLEGQMAKMNANLVRYRSLATLLSRRVGMLRYAATDGS